MRYQTVLISVVLLISSYGIFAQNRIRGVVQDAETGEKLQYANISLLNSGLGTMTNSEGIFVINLSGYKKPDTLAVSYLGYEIITSPLDSLFYRDNIFELVKSVEIIDEIVIKPIDPYQVLIDAIAARPLNYNRVSYNADGFYREILFENDFPVKLAEAAGLFNISPYNSPFDKSEAIWNYLDFSGYSSTYKYDQGLNYSTNATYPDDAVKIIQARSSDNLSGTISKFTINGGPLNITGTDIFRIEKFFFSKNGLKQLNRKNKFKASIDYKIYDSRNVYELLFKSKTDSDWLRVLVDRKTMAIICYEGKYNINNSSFMPRTGQVAGKKKNINDIVTEKYLEFRVDFKILNGDWYLNHIKSYGTYEYTYSAEDITVSLAIDRELIFNAYRTENLEPIPDSSQYKNIISNSLYDYPSWYDKDFWENYNQLYPTELQKEILKKMENSKPLEDQFDNKFTAFDSIKKPVAVNISDTILLYNDTIIDQFSWDKDSPELLDYIEQENKYALGYIYENNSLIKGIYNELNSYTNRERPEISFDTVNSYYYYFSKTGNFCRSISPDTIENEIVINLVDKTLKNNQYALYNYSFNKYGNILSYLEMIDGGRTFNLVCVDLNSLSEICSLKNALQTEWLDDHRFLYTSQYEGDFFPLSVYLYDINTNSEKLIFEEKDKSKKISLRESSSKQYVFIESFSFATNYKTVVIDKKSDITEPIFFANIPDSCYARFDHYNDKFYIRTNFTHPNFSIMVLPESDFDLQNAIQLFSFVQDTIIRDMNFIADNLILTYQNGITTDIGLLDTKTSQFSKITWDDTFYTVSFSKIVNGNRFEILFESYLVPRQKWIYDITDGSLRMIASKSVNHYESEKYEVKIVYASHPDGTEIPIVLIQTKKGKRTRPMLMEIYAEGLGSALLPFFRSDIFPLVDRGFIYAYPLVRGSGELGYEWNKRGAKLNKAKTFEDIAVCAEWLVEKKITLSEALFLYGTSAGGLPTGVAANEYPELFKGIILNVPNLVLLQSLMIDHDPYYLLNEDVYGNIENEQVYELIKNTDPYLNIKSQNYPNMLIFSALNDENVPVEGVAKYVAKLRQYKTDENILLFRTLMNEDHDGGFYGTMQRTALIYFFMLNLVY